MVPVTMPVFAVGLLTCIALELTGWFGYGAKLGAPVRDVLADYDREESARRTLRQKSVIVVQAVCAVVLVFALGLHLAEVGVIGLMIIILATAFNGVTEEHRLGHAFEEALPFTALLAVFFAVVAVIVFLVEMPLNSWFLSWFDGLALLFLTACFFAALAFLGSSFFFLGPTALPDFLSFLGPV